MRRNQALLIPALPLFARADQSDFSVNKFQCPYENPAFSDMGRSELNSSLNQQLEPDAPVTGFSVCFSGGGSRSLSLSRGQLAALKYLQLHGRINYISAVSGSAWGGVGYFFLQDDEMRRHYLGDVVEFPGDLYKGSEQDVSACNIAWLHSFSQGKVPQRLSLSGAVWYILSSLYSAPRNAWNAYLSKALLEPYGMNASSLLSDQYCKAGSDKPQIIVNAMLRSESGSVTPFEITPEEMGARKTDQPDAGARVPASDLQQGEIPFHRDINTVNNAKAFTLGELFSVTSANYAYFLPFSSNRWSPTSWFNPRIVHQSWNEWAVGIEEKTFDLIDSGSLDYLGIMPLLARKERKIVVFINTDIPLVRSGPVVGMEKEVPSYFGMIPDEDAKLGRYITFQEYNQSTWMSCEPKCSRNWSFPQDRYDELAEGLWRSWQSGGPAVYLQSSLPLRSNSFYGFDIEDETRVDVLWVYNELSDRWLSSLSNELQEMLRYDPGFVCSSAFCRKRRTRFPFFDSTAELYLNPEQVSMLFHLATWSVLQSRSSLFKMLERQ